MSKKLLPRVQRAAARALDRYDKNVLPSLAPYLFRALLEPRHLCELIISHRFDEILLAIEEAAPMMSARARKKFEDRQRQVEARAAERADVMERKKRKRLTEKRGRKKKKNAGLDTGGVDAGDDELDGGEAEAVLAGGGAAFNPLDAGDDDVGEGGDAGEEDDENFFGGQQPAMTQQSNGWTGAMDDFIEVGAIGRRKVYIKLSMIP